MTQEGNVLRPSEGKVLTNGSTYSKEVWLGINDSADNWWEVDEAEAQEITDAEALQIITGE